MDNPDAGELIAAYRHHGVTIPKGLEPPELRDIEVAFWDAFWDLSSDRQAGRPIPWSSLKRYFDSDGFGDFQTFKDIMGAMDGVYIKAKERKE